MALRRLGTVLLCAMLGMWSGPACAQLDLSWRNCVIAAPGEVDPVWIEDFDCNQPTEYLLVASIRFPETNGFQGLDAILDFESEAPGTLAPFWRFDAFSTLGCNDRVDVATDIGRLGRCTATPSMWDTVEIALLFSMDVDPLSPNRARLSVGIRGATFFYAGDHKYAFHLVIRTDRAPSCQGCSHPVAIVWNDAWLGREGGAELHLEGTGKVSPCVTVNGATATTCAATPVRNKTWGAIKALYR